MQMAWSTRSTTTTSTRTVSPNHQPFPIGPPAVVVIVHAACDAISEAISDGDLPEHILIKGAAGCMDQRLSHWNLHQATYLPEQVDVDFFLMAIPTTSIREICCSFLFSSRHSTIRHALFDGQCLQICSEPYNIAIPVTAHDLLHETTKADMIEKLEDIAGRPVLKAGIKNIVTTSHVRIDSDVLIDVLQTCGLDYVLIASYGIKMRYNSFMHHIGRHAVDWPESWPCSGERNEYDISRTMQLQSVQADQPPIMPTFAYDVGVARRVGLRRRQTRVYGQHRPGFGGIMFGNSTPDAGSGYRVSRSIVYNTGAVSWLRGYSCIPPHTFPDNRSLAKYFSNVSTLVERQRPDGLNRFRIEVRIRSRFAVEPFRLDVFGLAMYYRQNIRVAQMPSDDWQASCKRAVRVFRAANIAYGRASQPVAPRKQQMISSLINLLGWFDAKHPWYEDTPEVRDVMNGDHVARPEISEEDVQLRYERIEQVAPFGVPEQDLEFQLRQMRVRIDQRMEQRAQAAFAIENAQPNDMGAALDLQDAVAVAAIEEVRRSIKVRCDISISLNKPISIGSLRVSNC